MTIATARTIRRGTTSAIAPQQAIAEFAREVRAKDAALAVAFCDPHHARAPGFARSLQAEFGDVPVIGCTTAGEIGANGYQQGGCTGFSLPAGEFQVATALIQGVSRLRPDVLKEEVGQLEDQLVRDGGKVDSTRAFCMLLVDGLSMAEERLTYGLQGLLGPIRLFGGSAGDCLDFKETAVLHDGAFHQDAAVIMLVATDRPFQVFRTQHFEPTSLKCVVTRARPDQRIVTEIDGRVAACGYADLLGLPVQALTPEVFARNPLLVRMGGSWYVRSIQRVMPDQTLKIYCAIDEGLVLTLGKGQGMASGLASTLDTVASEIGSLQLVVGSDCILRRLEAEGTGVVPAINGVFARHNVVGFSTYGEQCGAVHVNQTFTGVAIG